MTRVEYWIEYKTKHKGVDGQGIPDYGLFIETLKRVPEGKIARCFKRTITDEEIE